MTPHEFIGYTLLNTAAVTALTSIISHGKRPSQTGTPCVNFYEVDSTELNGMGTTRFSMNCRDKSPSGAMALAKVVIQTFNGSSGTGIRGTNNGFDVASSFLESQPGLTPEPEDELYNAPVDVLITYDLDTVS